MLSKTQVVKARKAIELLYVGTCTITERKKVRKENKSTGFEEVVVLKDQPCRQSYRTVTETTPDDSGASAVTQAVVVLLAPEIIVQPGSKLTITQNGNTVEYSNSGEAARYSTHQEIALKLFKGWA